MLEPTLWLNLCPTLANSSEPCKRARKSRQIICIPASRWLWISTSTNESAVQKSRLSCSIHTALITQETDAVAVDNTGKTQLWHRYWVLKVRRVKAIPEISSIYPAPANISNYCHPGRLYHKIGSSSSLNSSFNQRTSNTTLSASLHDGFDHHLPSRKSWPEGLNEENNKARNSRDESLAGSATPPQRNGYGHQLVGPSYPSNPRHRPESPFTIPPSSCPFSSCPYVACPGPQRDTKVCATSNEQPHFVTEHPSLDIRKSQNKKRRGDLQKWQTDVMKQWYEDHIRNPYPTKFEKQEMARKSELTLGQVKHAAPTPFFIPSALDSVQWLAIPGLQLVHELPTTAWTPTHKGCRSRVDIKKTICLVESRFYWTFGACQAAAFSTVVQTRAVALPFAMKVFGNGRCWQCIGNTKQAYGWKVPIYHRLFRRGCCTISIREAYNYWVHEYTVIYRLSHGDLGSQR